MLRIGLTGGTGAGKSTVAARLAELGAVVIDADVLAREVVAPGSEGLAAVVGEFGEAVLTSAGVLDRQALATLAFTDPSRRRALEAITHPRIARRTQELLAAAPAEAIVVHDVPLLVEKHMGARYHLVVVVDAPVDVRVLRLVRQRGMTEEDARARVGAQASDAERRAAADVWVENLGSVHSVRDAVDRLWARRLVPFEANVRTRTAVRRPEVPLIAPPDPSWPEQAARLVARIATAAGDLGGGVEHVGSTAVPGLVANDVIDLQLAVPSLADADAIADRLAEAGFPRFAGEWWDVAHGGQGQWEKRLHGGADPARVVQLHVRQAGSPGWRFALLFRDWLRAEPRAREEYAAEKQRLALRSATTGEYAQAKEPWFGRARPRAEQWASATCWTPGSSA